MKGISLFSDEMLRMGSCLLLPIKFSPVPFKSHLRFSVLKFLFVCCLPHFLIVVFLCLSLFHPSISDPPPVNCIFHRHFFATEILPLIIFII